MSPRIRFSAAIFAACVLHAIAAPLLLKIGWQCPARFTGGALAQEGVSVSLVEIARSEIIQPPANDHPQQQDLRGQIQETAADTPAELLETPTHEEFTKFDETQPPHTEASDIQQQEILSLPPENNKESPIPYISAASTNRPARSVNSAASTPKPNPLASAPAPRQIDTGPALISNPRPPYPAQARAQGEEGTVYIKVNIDASGKISAASIVRSSGREDLDLAAIKTVREKWRFKPARAAGLPVPCEKTISVEFRLR